MSVADESAKTTWLAQRRLGIGASEAAAVLNLSPWVTPLTVYLRKLGLIPEQEQTERMKWGLRWERLILDEYNERTGIGAWWFQELRTNLDATFMLATADARASDRVVELKKVSDRNAADFGPTDSDQIPVHIRLQVQQQMACCQVELADVAALIGDDDFRVYTIERDDDLIARLVEAERLFMGMVERREPPMPDFTHPSTLDILRMMEPDESMTVALAESVVPLVDDYEACGRIEKMVSGERDQIKARLIHAMQGAAVAVLPDGRRITRKEVNRAGYEVKPTKYFDFRISKVKGQSNVDDHRIPEAIYKFLGGQVAPDGDGVQEPTGLRQLSADVAADATAAH